MHKLIIVNKNRQIIDLLRKPESSKITNCPRSMTPDPSSSRETLQQNSCQNSGTDSKGNQEALPNSTRIGMGVR